MLRWCTNDRNRTAAGEIAVAGIPIEVHRSLKRCWHPTARWLFPCSVLTTAVDPQCQRERYGVLPFRQLRRTARMPDHRPEICLMPLHGQELTTDNSWSATPRVILALLIAECDGMTGLLVNAFCAPGGVHEISSLLLGLQKHAKSVIRCHDLGCSVIAALSTLAGHLRRRVCSPLAVAATGPCPSFFLRAVFNDVLILPHSEFSSKVHDPWPQGEHQFSDPRGR
jgi:hypothetical protein